MVASNFHRLSIGLKCLFGSHSALDRAGVGYPIGLRAVQPPYIPTIAILARALFFALLSGYMPDCVR